ncbi:hypothetical protein C4D60_Mb05t10390 [Musa balbisiana]|uniref:J domain-containing protein n=1 Tax=Musa balbisiana TaxID=52838 RepID=A0A4S8JV44_MUSBA|nr:hypothetical protein C4D60_Mb05t10390 [Musa balbisiana]
MLALPPSASGIVFLDSRILGLRVRLPARGVNESLIFRTSNPLLITASPIRGSLQDICHDTMFYAHFVFQSCVFYLVMTYYFSFQVLGVDKSASQRDIQKAFHKLSLKYHPDKNKSKGAQEKFAEINNAYEILSDEEKRKNYDLYGDEKLNPGFGGNYGDEKRNPGFGGNFGNYQGHTTGGPGSSYFTSNQGGWQSMGSKGNARTFSFAFSRNPSVGGNPFGFGFGNIFSDFFRGGVEGGNQHDSFSTFGGPNSQFSSHGNIQDVDLQLFNKQIKDQGLTWILLFYTSSATGHHVLESIMEDVASSLMGAVKAGKIDCKKQSLCKDMGVSLPKSARLFIYSYKSAEKASLVEYSGDLDPRSLKNFCLDQLPRFSRRIEFSQFDFSPDSSVNRPQVLLLSTKKETPVMWRVISGLYRNRFLFYDAEAHDVSHPMLKRLGVKKLPSVVGKLVTGEMHVLRSGIIVKDLKSGIEELRTLLESFEKKNKVSSDHSKKPSQNEEGGNVPFLTTWNIDNLCGEKATVCFIGVFRSSKGRDKLEKIVSEVSRKTLVRQQSKAQTTRDSITYSLLDGNKQLSFLYAFDKLGYGSLDKFLIAYKPRKQKFAAFTGDVTMEAVEKFVSSVLNGDIQFSKVRQQPVIR